MGKEENFPKNTIWEKIHNYCQKTRKEDEDLNMPQIMQVPGEGEQ